MNFFIKKKFIFVFFISTVVLTACIFPEKEDPFEKLTKEELKTISGKIFPFSVSVSTRATHRLEKDGKLVSYIASKIVNLDDFLGRQVEVDGLFRKEKMRELFWVESIRVINLPTDIPEEEKKDQRFYTKKFSFIFPNEWEYTTSPDGILHFVAKNDQARRVFLKFSVEDLQKEDKKNDPNILISNLAGIKKLSNDNLDKEYQEIILFSNIFPKKYKFIFNASFEEFEKKKSFFKLLNTFIEGESNVKNAIEEDQKKEAEKEAEKIKLLQEKESQEKEIQDLLEKTKEKNENTNKAFIKKLFTDEDEKKSTDETEKILEQEEPLSEKIEEITPEKILEKTEKKDIPISKTPEISENNQAKFITGNYKNLIDNRAFFYESAFYKFSMKIPYGFWFRNFGASPGYIATIGFSNEQFLEKNSAKFRLEIVSSTNVPQNFSEKLDGEKIIMEFPRSSNSFFRFSGHKSFRDAMMSIYATIQNF